MTTSRLLVPMLMLAVPLTVAPGVAHAWEAALDMGVVTQNMVTGSTRFFASGNSLVGSSLRLGTAVAPHVFIELDWLSSSTSRDRFSSGSGGYEAELSDDAVSLAARYRIPLLSFLEPFVRAGLGATRHAIKLTGTSGARFEAVKYAPHLVIGGGADLVISRASLWQKKRGKKPRATFGLSFEMGWQHTFGRDLELDRQDTLDPALPTKPLNLAALQMSGFTTRFALCVRI